MKELENAILSGDNEKVQYLVKYYIKNNIRPEEILKSLEILPHNRTGISSITQDSLISYRPVPETSHSVGRRYHKFFLRFYIPYPPSP